MTHKAFTGRPPLAAVNRRSVVGGVGVAVVVVVAWLVSPDPAVETLEWIAADPVRFGLLAIGLAAVRPFLAWPTTLLAVVVGFGYGWVGVPFAALLLTATAFPPYWLAKRGRVHLTGGSRTLARVSETADRLVADAGSVRAIAATRFLPVPADAVSVAAGVSGIRTRPFVVGTAIGEFPWVIAGVALGVSADRLARNDLSAVDPSLILALALVGLLLLAGPIYRTVRSTSHVTPSE